MEEIKLDPIARLTGAREESEDEKAPPTRAQRRAYARFVATRERKGTQAWRRSQEEQRRLQARVELLTEAEKAELAEELQHGR